jgi:hypothetical protein
MLKPAEGVQDLGEKISCPWSHPLKVDPTQSCNRTDNKFKTSPNPQENGQKEVRTILEEI